MDKIKNDRFKISCKNAWKIFGADPQVALNHIKKGMTKEDILEKTGHVIAVQDASFDVIDGEVFMVMGLSGSGKSTLARCINGLIKPTMGQVLIDGDDLGSMSEEEIRETRRHKISMVFQHFALFPHRTVIDNVAYGLEVQGQDKAQRHKKALEVLNTVGLKGWSDSYPSELSGGMQQRVGLARALALDPEILLMDEPFSALDPLIRRQMQDEFANLVTKVRKTIVFITHDLNEALRLGTTVAIMKDGKIVQLGSPEEIVRHPANEYVAEFCRDVPRDKVVPIRSIMQKPKLILHDSQETGQAMQAMREQNCEYTFVVNSGSKLLGTIQIDKLDKAIKQGKTTLADVPLEIAPQINAEQPFCDVIPLSADSVNPIAAVDNNRKLTGEVPRETLLKVMAEQKEAK